MGLGPDKTALMRSLSIISMYSMPCRPCGTNDDPGPDINQKNTDAGERTQHNEPING
jgi:hypothetical protein